MIRLLEQNGWVLERNGAEHDIYRKDDKREAIPRHKELNELLAKAIIRREGLKQD